MRPAEELQTEIATLRERLLRLSTAGVRINESLDLSVVLREVAESARALTGAGYGGVTTLDNDGRMLEFVGSGFSDEEYEQLMSLPEGQQVFEYLSAVPGPLRTRDLSEHVRSRGFPGGPLLMKTYLGTPVRHRNRQVAMTGGPGAVTTGAFHTDLSGPSPGAKPSLQLRGIPPHQP